MLFLDHWRVCSNNCVHIFSLYFSSYLNLLFCQAWALQSLAVPMDATTSGTPAIQYHNIPDQPITAIIVAPVPTFQRNQRHCFGESTPGEFPLAASPSIVLHVLTACNLDPQDLAKLEASVFFLIFFFDNTALIHVRTENAADFIFNCVCCRQHAHSLGSQQTLPLTINCPYLSLLLWTCAKRELYLSQ